MNMLAGGEAEKKDINEFDVCPYQLAMGVAVELEHTQDPEVAKEIALDHLAEIPDYYSRLSAMENEAKGDNTMEKVMRYEPSGDGKPGESLKETSTQELIETYKDLDAMLEDPGKEDSGVQERHDAIRAELKRRDALPPDERSEAPVEEYREHKHARKSMPAGLEDLGQYLLEKAGPYIGPKGGKWADPQHKIPYKEYQPMAKKDFKKEMDRRRKEGLTLSGNTYPIKEVIKAAGGVWDRYKKEWLVPDKEVLGKLQVLMQATPAKQKAASSSIPSSGGKATPKQVNYAMKLIKKLEQEDYGTFTTFGYQNTTTNELAKLTKKQMSDMIDSLRSELH